MSGYFGLLIVVLCIQSISVKSGSKCNPQKLKNDILSKLNNSQKYMEAYKDIGQLSWCSEPVLKKAAEKAQAEGKGRRFYDAANKADKEGWGNSKALRRIKQILSSTSCVGASPGSGNWYSHNNHNIGASSGSGNWYSHNNHNSGVSHGSVNGVNHMCITNNNPQPAMFSVAEAPNQKINSGAFNRPMFSATDDDLGDTKTAAVNPMSTATGN